MLGKPKIEGRTKDTLKAARLQAKAVIAPSDGIAELGLLGNGVVLAAYAALLWMNRAAWSEAGVGILVFWGLVQFAAGIILVVLGFVRKKKKWAFYGPGLLLNLAAGGLLAASVGMGWSTP